MYDAYTRIFTRLGLKFRAVQADSGSHRRQRLAGISRAGRLRRGCDRLLHAPWPNEQPYFMAAHEEVSWFIDLVSTIRSVRTEMNVPAGSLIQLALIKPSASLFEKVGRWDASLNRLARISGTVDSEKAPAGAIQIVVGSDTFALELSGVIDIAAERARLAKEMAKAEADIDRVDKKLGNADFLRARARRCR